MANLKTVKGTVILPPAKGIKISNLSKECINVFVNNEKINTL